MVLIALACSVLVASCSKTWRSEALSFVLSFKTSFSNFLENLRARKVQPPTDKYTALLDHLSRGEIDLAEKMLEENANDPTFKTFGSLMVSNAKAEVASLPPS